MSLQEIVALEQWVAQWRKLNCPAFPVKELPRSIDTLASLRRVMEYIGVLSWDVETPGPYDWRVTVPERYEAEVREYIGRLRTPGHKIEVNGKLLVSA